MTPHDRKILTPYKAGKTWKEIRLEAGVTDGQIRAALKRNPDVPMRLPGRKHGQHHDKPGVTPLVRTAMDTQVLFAVLLSVRTAEAVYAIGKDQAKAFGVDAPSREAVAKFIRELREKIG